MSKTSTKININEFEGNRYTGFEPKSDTYEKEDGTKGSYNTLNTFYNYGTETEPNLEQLLYELPEISSDRNGLYRKGPKQGKNGPYYEESVRLIFDHSRPEIQQAITKITEIEKADAMVLNPWKGKMKMHNFKPEMAEATGLTPLLQYKRDSTTNEIIPGLKPSRFYKVTGATNFLLPKLERDAAGNPVINPNTGKPKITYEKLKHEMLIGRQITMIPLIVHSHIYSSGNGKGSPQEKIYSAVVTNLKEGGGGEQVETAVHYAEANVDRVSDLEAEIAQLKMQLEGSNNMKSSVPTTSGADKSSNESFMGGQPPAQPASQPVAQYQPPQAPQSQNQQHSPPQQAPVAQVQMQQPQPPAQFQPPPSTENLQATQAQMQAQPQMPQMPQPQAPPQPTIEFPAGTNQQVQYQQPQQQFQPPAQYQAPATPTQGQVQVNQVPGMPQQQPQTNYL